MEHREVVIVSAVRTAIGSFNGSLKDISAVQLGSAVLESAITRAGIEKQHVNEVIMGNVPQAGLGQNPARQAAINAGIPISVPAMGLGLKAVHLATQAILSGNERVEKSNDNFQ